MRGTMEIRTTIGGENGELYTFQIWYYVSIKRPRIKSKKPGRSTLDRSEGVVMREVERGLALLIGVRSMH
jgi:hypothetical protein